MHVTALGWIDTSLVTANLRLRYWERFEGAGDVRTLPLHDDDGPLPIMEGDKKFGSAVTFLSRLRSKGAQWLRDGHPAEFGRVWLEMLEPHGATPWTLEDDPEWLQVRVCLLTPPEGWFYCGSERATLGVGFINLIDTAAPCSSFNQGDAPRVHMVLNVRRPPPAEA